MTAIAHLAQGELHAHLTVNKFVPPLECAAILKKERTMRFVICAALVALLSGCVAYYPHHGYRDGDYGHTGYYDRDGRYHDYDHDRDHYRGSYIHP